MKKQLMKKTLITFMLTLSIVSLCWPSKEAGAYFYRDCDGDKLTWSEECSSCATMRISTTSFPPGSVWDNELQSAMASYNDIDRARFNFFVARDSDGSHDDDNSRNEVYFDGIDGPGGVLAVTRLRMNNCLPFDDADIKEADVEFDTNENWYLGDFNYTTSNIHFRLVAVHEFGHVLGLVHEDRVMDRMNSFYPNGGPMTQSKLVRATADTCQGVRFLYPESGTARADLVGSNFERTGSGTSNLVDAPTSANRGSTITGEFTFMNNGSANSGNFNIGFYLSSNDTISTGDRLIATNYNASANAGGVVTFARSLTIPNDLAPGTYYLGIILDKDNTVTELSDGNNSLSYHRTITIH